ncbi:MAG TPA: hypothetical protein VFQ53_12175 [Kofleriaceae bacterium]|nr:hypothetical protein [Kofleriaceae bacterium]
MVAVLRLTALFVGLGLATSRIGLVLHELVGHGGMALAVGGEVGEARLFWFAGGWIRYTLDEPGPAALLLVNLGGILVELAVGTALVIALARRRSLAATLVRGIAAALIVHAGWYFATGTWHGYGDGMLVYHQLGAARYPVAVVVGAAICALAYATTIRVLVPLAQALPGSRRARLAGIAAAIALAGGLQIGLALGEIAVRGDTLYGAIMKPERERVIARELAAWQREQAARGIVVDDAAREALRKKLARQHREPPFLPILGAALGLSVALALWRGTKRGQAHDDNITRGPSARAVAIAGLCAVGSIVLVIAIDLAFH